MAVRTTAVSDHAPATNTEKSVPIRTCVGCRQKAPASDLLRVAARVVVRESASPAGVQILPDPHRRAAGRGAWVHPEQTCVDQAQRRRAFVRALRIPSGPPIDTDAVSEFVRAVEASTDRPSP